jgi:hypothetical protein
MCSLSNVDRKAGMTLGYLDVKYSNGAKISQIFFSCYIIFIFHISFFSYPSSAPVLKMSTSSFYATEMGKGSDGKQALVSSHAEALTDESESEVELEGSVSASLGDAERRLVGKIDLRLCAITGILCSLNLLGGFGGHLVLDTGRG